MSDYDRWKTREPDYGDGWWKSSRDEDLEAADLLITRLKDDNDRLLEALDALLGAWASDSYCEWCEAHAPKTQEGEIIGPVPHKSDCAGQAARSTIAEVRSQYR